MNNQTLAFKAGYLAHTNRKVVGDNPYDDQSNEKEHFDWMAGWLASAEEAMK